MAKKQRGGASYKGAYKSYAMEGRHAKNKIANLKRVVKEQPNNEEAKEVLKAALANGVVYKRNRRSAGHICKGKYKELGFVKNEPSVGMLKGRVGIQKFLGLEYKRSPSLPASTPLRHGKNMEEQLIAVGFDKPRRGIRAR